jgi:hypothetical protein
MLSLVTSLLMAWKNNTVTLMEVEWQGFPRWKRLQCGRSCYANTCGATMWFVVSVRQVRPTFLLGVVIIKILNKRGLEKSPFAPPSPAGGRRRPCTHTHMLCSSTLQKKRHGWWTQRLQWTTLVNQRMVRRCILVGDRFAMQTWWC